jgi:hypothetical protein
MRALIGIALVILPFLGHASAQGGSAAAGSITGLYAALAVAVSSDASSTGPIEMNMAAVTSTTSTQLTVLRAMDCAFSRKVHQHA